MTRKESINNAAVRFATQFIDTGETDFYGHFVKEQGLDHAEYRGFIAGAKWADANPKSGLIDLSQIWNEAEEEPKKGEWILGEYQGGIYQTYLYGYVDCEWSSYVKVFSLLRWAYIKDLLPKGGEAWK